MQNSALRETGPKSIDRLLPALAGLFTAAAVARLLVSTHRYDSFVPLFVVAAAHIALTVVANAIGVRVAGYLLFRNAAGVSRLSTPAAAWMAPLAVYMKSGSLLAIPLAGVVAVFATSVLRHVIEIPDERGKVAARSAGRSEIFHLLPTPSPHRLFSLVGAAMCAEAALVEGAGGKHAIAIAFISLGSGIVAWQAGGSRTAKSATRIIGNLAFSVLVLVLAVILTTRAIVSESGGTGDASIERPKGEGAGGQYWGVILWTDAPKPDPQQTKSQPTSAPSLVHKGIKVPLRIKFNGVYWFYRWPNRRIPSTAESMFGRPDEIGFHTTDSTPLIMEAHQVLQNHIDLACCSQIDVDVRNSDAFPGTINVELLLSDSSVPLVRPVSLGQAVVAELESIQEKSRSVTLNFRMPESPSISSFNQITFRFYPNVNRRTVSPRVAIRDLILIPR